MSAIWGGLLPIAVIQIKIWLLSASREFLQAKQEKTVAQGHFDDLFKLGLAGHTLLLWVSYFFTLMVVYLMLNWLPSLVQELGFTRKQGSIAFLGIEKVGRLCWAFRRLKTLSNQLTADAMRVRERKKAQTEVWAFSRIGAGDGL